MKTLEHSFSLKALTKKNVSSGPTPRSGRARSKPLSLVTYKKLPWYVPIIVACFSPSTAVVLNIKSHGNGLNSTVYVSLTHSVASPARNTAANTLLNIMIKKNAVEQKWREKKKHNVNEKKRQLKRTHQMGTERKVTQKRNARMTKTVKKSEPRRWDAPSFIHTS